MLEAAIDIDTGWSIRQKISQKHKNGIIYQSGIIADFPWLIHKFTQGTIKSINLRMISKTSKVIKYVVYDKGFIIQTILL